MPIDRRHPAAQASPTEERAKWLESVDGLIAARGPLVAARILTSKELDYLRTRRRALGDLNPRRPARPALLPVLPPGQVSAEFERASAPPPLASSAPPSRSLPTNDAPAAFSRRSPGRSALESAINQLQAHNPKETIIYPQADTALPAQEASDLRMFLDHGEMPEGWMCKYLPART